MTPAIVFYNDLCTLRIIPRNFWIVWSELKSGSHKKSIIMEISSSDRRVNSYSILFLRHFGNFFSIWMVRWTQFSSNLISSFRFHFLLVLFKKFSRFWQWNLQPSYLCTCFDWKDMHKYDDSTQFHYCTRYKMSGFLTSQLLFCVHFIFFSGTSWLFTTHLCTRKVPHQKWWQKSTLDMKTETLTLWRLTGQKTFCMRTLRSVYILIPFFHYTMIQ